MISSRMVGIDKKGEGSVALILQSITITRLRLHLHLHLHLALLLSVLDDLWIDEVIKPPHSPYIIHTYYS